MHLEDSMVMYGICNAVTLEQLINTVHYIHNSTSSNEKLFAGQQGTAVPESLKCKCIKHTTVLHKFIIIYENCERQIYFIVKRVYNAIAHIYNSY